MPTPSASLQEHLLLTGFFPLHEYLHWRSLMAPAGEAELYAAWRRCAAAATALHAHPAPRVEPLPAGLHAYRDRFLNDATIQSHGSPLRPAEIALVELDALAIYQRHVNLVWADELRRRWLSLSNEPERFAFCLSTAAPDAPVFEARLSDDTFVFTSPSQDLRVQKLLSLPAARIHDWTPPGPPIAIAGAAIGFGSNCLQAIQWESRLILVNGTHRAFALRQAGETMAPCLLQRIESEEEMAVVAPVLQESGAGLLTAARPPLLRDLFDAQLTERLLLPRRIRQVRVTISVEEVDLPG